MFGSTRFPFSGSGFGTSTATTSSTGGLFSSTLFSTATTSSSSTTFGGLGGFGNLTGSSTFGASNAFKPATSSTFGLSTALVPVSNAGTTIKYEPVISTDMMKKGAINQKQSIKFVAITAMTQYQSKSFEELRLEDYAANRKSSTALTLFKPTIGGSSPFGSVVSSSGGSSWFNRSFGGLTSTATTSSSSVFGSTTANKPLFQTGTFGLNTSLTTTTTSSGGFSFGTPATTTQSNIFGQPSTGGGLFSTVTTTSAGTFSLFGSGTTTTTSSGGLFSFGSTSTASGGASSLFSQKPIGTSPFGGGSLFSSTSTTATTTSSPFSFGLSKPSTGIFGQPATSSSPFSLGLTQPAQTSSTSSIFGSTSTGTSVNSSPANALLLLSAAKDKDPEVMRRSAQMLLRAQCFSYSDDPIFQDFTPTTCAINRVVSASNPVTTNAEKKSPEPLSRRVRSLLSPSAMNIGGLYHSLDTEYRPESLELRGGRTLDLRRLVLPAERATLKSESPTNSVKIGDRGNNTSDRTLGEFLSDTSRSFRAPIDDDVEQDVVPCCKLTRVGYNTCPSLNKLSVDRTTGSCIVSDFSIYREGYGSITWPGLTDIGGLDLDKIVFIRRKEVIVYPDDESKPPLNEGLNKAAEITLHSVYPLDKKTRLPIKDPWTLEDMNYERFLEEATARMGAEFIDYDTNTGSWTFKVEHFTRYGLDITEELVDRGPALAVSKSFSRWQNKFEKHVTHLESDSLGASRFAPDVFSTVLNGNNEKTDETVPIKEVTRRMGSMVSNFSKEEEDMDEYMAESLGLADVSCYNIERFTPFWIQWQNSLFNTDRDLSWDPTFSKGRTFRFNFVGAKRICFPRATNSLTSLKRAQYYAESPKDSALDWLLATQFTHKQVKQLDMPFPLIRVTQTPEYVKQLDDVPGEISGENLAQYIKSSVSLLRILFHQDEDSSEQKQQLIKWLLNEKALSAKTTSFLKPTSAILDALCDLDRKKAVTTALSAKYFRLAQLLSIPPGHAVVQNLLKMQMIHWCDNGADQFIDKDLLKIYLLLSGELFIELSDGTLLSLLSDRGWVELLIVILRYSCLVDAPCRSAIILLDNLMKSGLYPHSDDYRWNILKFFIDPATADMAELLQPVQFFRDEDYRLSWHLLQAIQSLGVVSIPRELCAGLCSEFARQLEAMGRLDWAAYVLSQVEAPHLREALCETFLQRIASADYDLTCVESRIIKQLGWSKQRVYLAKSYRAQYDKNWFLCCSHRIQSEDFTGALSLIFERILSEAFHKDDRSDLVELLNLLHDYVSRGVAVGGWVHSGQFLYEYFNAQLKFAAPKYWSIDQDELLYFAETISSQFHGLSQRFNDVLSEERISASILRVIAEGICSSICLLCKWVGDGTYEQTDQQQRATSIVDMSKVILANMDTLSYSK